MTIENSIHCKVSLTLKWVFFDFKMTIRIEVERRRKKRSCSHFNIFSFSQFGWSSRNNSIRSTPSYCFFFLICYTFFSFCIGRFVQSRILGLHNFEEGYLNYFISTLFGFSSGICLCLWRFTILYFDCFFRSSYNFAHCIL